MSVTASPRRLRALLLALAATCAAPAFAADLFTAPPPNRFAEAAPGVYPLRVDAAVLAQAIPGDRLRINLPGNSTYEVLLESSRRGSGGSLTWVGRIAGYSDDYRVILTVAANGEVLGQMRLPGVIDRLDQLYRVEPARVVSAFAAGEVAPLGSASDERIPPPPKPVSPGFAQSRLGPADIANTQDGVRTRVDLLVLYSRSMPGKYSAGIDALIDHLVALTNQAYIDSRVNMELFVSGKVQVDYAEDTTNDQALTDLTERGDIAFANVTAWREQYGADLVTVIRPLDSTVMTDCGVAWVNGADGYDLDSERVYSVVSYGKSGNARCDDYTLAHEIGHTLGAAHDRANAKAVGHFPYSYGLGLANTFGTIMSYISPLVGKFSNPDVSCNGYPCGNPLTDPKNQANNALTFNNVKATVANFMPMVVNLPLTGVSLASQAIRTGAATTLVAVPSGALLPACSSSDITVATVSGNMVTAGRPGTATLTCGSYSVALTVLDSNATPPDTTPPVTPLSLSAAVSSAGNGNPRLTINLTPESSDDNIGATLYLAASTSVNGLTYWYMHDGQGWQPYTGLLTSFGTAKLSKTTPTTIVALNGEMAPDVLQRNAITIYAGYAIQAAGSSLKYGKAYAF